MITFSKNPLTHDELEALVRMLADPANDDSDHDEYCDTCCGGLPGTIAPIYPEGDDAHLFVECCGSCRRIDDGMGDEAAAFLIASALGLRVRRRYDDDSLRYYRVFLVRPGAVDDHDTYCIGASEVGTWPSLEVALLDGWRGRIQRRRIRAQYRRLTSS